MNRSISTNHNFSDLIFSPTFFFQPTITISHPNINVLKKRVGSCILR